MATFSKFDMSSGSPDRPLYANGQRGSNLAVSIDRSVSFRESMENPILSSLPNMSRSSSCVTQGDAVDFFQCLRFDPKVVAADHKSSRQVDLKRHINVALGSVDDSPSVSLKGKLVPSPIPEEIKRIKAGLRESSVKARERMKIFNEALSVFNKFFPSIPSKKRSRSDGFSNDRTNAMISSDRSVLAPNLGKMGLQNHAISGFEPDQQKPEERAKSAVPKKRTRTSLMDVRMDARSSTIVRTSSVVDRERDMVRLPNGAVQGDDRSLSIAVDGWENSKMRKKRSGLRPDLSPTLVSAKATDGYREPKQGMQQRPVTDVRLKSNNDSHGFRPGAANGAMGIGKSDGVSQQTGLVMRSSAPRTDTADNGSLPSERRDRSIGSDKERVNLRAVNRTNIRDSPNSDSTMSSTKMNAPVRGPRSGSGIAPKLPSVVHRATASNDWELSHCTNKSAAVIGVNNRKRMSSARSSSPPVTHWAGQRPQKISRTARRTNLVPIVSNNDETSALHAVSDATGHEVGLGFARHLTGSSPKQGKIKGEPISSTALSESEESGAPEIKSKERCKKSDEIEEKAGQNVQKMSTLILPTRKNKLLTGEDPGDNIRRHGRCGRGFTSTRSLVPASAEKLGNVGTAKQLRSTRLGFEKSDSKTGRPPTRKLSNRKAYKRHKHMAASTTADFVVGSDDGHEELLAAANAVIDPAHALSSLFWRQMEPLFGVISDIDIASLEQQESFETTAATAPKPSSVDGINIVANGNGLIDSDGEVGLVGETRDITLCQRLISAMISEEDYTSGNDDLEFDEYGSESDLDGEWQEKGLNQLDNIQFTGHAPFKGYKMPGEQEHGQPKVNKLDTRSMGINSNFGHPPNGQLLDQAPMPDIAYHELQYDNMNMNEKLYLELQSIGICPEIIPDRGQRTEGIFLDISKLEEEYHGWISSKKILLNSLIKSASVTKELQEKEFEGHAHDKLVTMAYQKYMTCWGPNATGGKNSSKMAKQSALAFVKRTLERCHKFEDMGKSCFSEPLFKDILLSRPSQLNSSPSVNTPTDGESAKPFTNTTRCSLEGRVSASMVSQPANLVSWLSQNGNSYIDSSDMLPPVNQLPEQTSVKEEVWSNRMKKREILLDDVIGGTLSSAPSSIAISLSGSTKGKISERDREGKGHSKEVLSRNGNNKIGRPALSNVKGERKSKTKPKQKTTQLSVSVNGLLGKISEQPKPTLLSESKSSDMITNAKEKNGFGLDSSDEAIDLSHLQLPGMDVLGAPDDFDGQGQDLGSWLNIDDDGLQDHDFMGLEIPMDDLSDLNMMV